MSGLRRSLPAVLAVALLVPAGAQAGRVKVSGGAAAATISACEQTRSATVLDPDTTATARVVGKGKRKRGRLVLERCVAGKWLDGRAIGKRRGRVSQHVGDFRIRSVGKRKARPAYLRFGVGEIVDVPFSVDVENVNTTMVLCSSDGAERTLSGHLTAPRSVLSARDPSVTLFLHGFGYGEFFWRLRAVPGYATTTKLAEAGHASVTIDRAGYGASKLDGDGMATCLGSQADMAHQVIDALKAGSYRVMGDEPVRFKRAALVGHSAGGAIAQIAARSFTGIDALGIISYADEGQSPLLVEQLAVQSLTCATGGAPGTPGYAPLGATEEDFRAGHLNAPTDPKVADAVVAMRMPEPCGDPMSAPPALLFNQTQSGGFGMPVLLLSGADDAFFGPGGVMAQGERFGGASASVTTEIVPTTGHAIVFGESADTVVDALEAWLTANGF